MQELISVKLAGRDRDFPLEQDAHAELRRYLDNARAGLSTNPDRTEILEDIERSLGDRLSSPGSPRADRISVAEIRAALDAIGAVAGERVADGVSVGAQRPRGRFWCRIKEGSWFGGICLGVAAYGQFRVDWVRTVFIILGLLSGGVLILVYLVLLLVLPVVPSLAEYEARRDAPAAAD